MKVFLLIVGMCIAFSSLSQQNVVTSGQTVTGSGGTISYSLGQVDFVSFNDNMNAGLQQPFSLGPFPVTLLNFTGVKKETSVVLNWQTTNEINASHFIVQRSTNGSDFAVEIEKQNAKGGTQITSSYLLEDLTPASGINYYRLKQVDKDGSFIYSPVVAVNFQSGISVLAYPNPAKDNIRISIRSANLKDCSYKLYDITGRILKQSSIHHQQTNIAITDINSGVYILKVFQENGATVFSIIKQ